MDDPYIKKFNEAVFSNPNFEISGSIRTPDGRSLDLKPLLLSAAMIAEHFMDHIAQTLGVITRESDGATGRPRMPKVIFSPDPRPNAMTQVQGRREIHLNLGLVLSLSSLPLMTSLLADLFSDKPTDLSILIDPTKSHNLQLEIGRVMEGWRQSSALDWQIIPTSLTSGLSDWWLFQEMLRFIIGHEFAHWLISIYKTDYQRKFLDTAEQDIKDWLSEDRATDKHIRDNIQQLLRNSNILDRWKHEISADAMGFQLCLQAFGGIRYPQLRMGAYAGAALAFAMNGMLEVFLASSGTPVTGETHPSSYARLLIFTHIMAKQFSISQEEFLRKEFGAGMAAVTLFAKVLAQYEAQS